MSPLGLNKGLLINSIFDKCREFSSYSQEGIEKKLPTTGKGCWRECYDSLNIPESEKTINRYRSNPMYILGTNLNMTSFLDVVVDMLPMRAE